MGLEKVHGLGEADVDDSAQGRQREQSLVLFLDGVGCHLLVDGLDVVMRLMRDVVVEDGVPADWRVRSAWPEVPGVLKVARHP